VPHPRGARLPGAPGFDPEAWDGTNLSHRGLLPAFRNTSNGSQQQSAKGYVPETPWNDTCENPINAAFLESIATIVGASGVATPEEACNFVYADSLELYFDDDDPPIMNYVDTVGGSGGASSCVVNTTTITNGILTPGACNSTDTSTGSSYGNLALYNDGWPKPTWQTNAASLGVPADGVRDLPDVSFFAGDGTLNSATLICVSNDGAQCTNLSETGSTNASDTGGAEEVGGTSVATPEMAGVMALINQKVGTSQGSPNAEFYKLAGMQTYTCSLAIRKRSRRSGRLCGLSSCGNTLRRLRTAFRYSY